MAALMERLSLCRYGYGKRYLAKNPLFFLSPVRLMVVMEKIEMLRGVERELAAVAVGDRVCLFSFEDEPWSWTPIFVAEGEQNSRKMSVSNKEGGSCLACFTVRQDGEYEACL